MSDDEVRRAAARAAGFDPADAELVECHREPIGGSSGAATAQTARLAGRVRSGAVERPFSLVRKEFRPAKGGPHATAARDEKHWAYWRRELLAYAEKAVPSGPHLTAPTCFEVGGNAVYLADVTGPPENVRVAAERLGRWQAQTPIPDVAWLGGHQLAQRLAVTTLDWSAVDAPAEFRRIWDRREELLATLASVPQVICHGDFHHQHLIAAPGATVVLDWGTLGAGPAGADLAHLALSTGEDLLDAYLDGLAGAVDPAAVTRGYAVTRTLTATSRAHWMRSRGLALPPSYLAAAGEA